MINYKELSLAHELVSRLKSHYLVHICGVRYPTENHEFTLVSWAPLTQDMMFTELDALIETLIELLENQKEKLDV